MGKKKENWPAASLLFVLEYFIHFESALCYTDAVTDHAQKWVVTGFYTDGAKNANIEYKSVADNLGLNIKYIHLAAANGK